MLKSENTDIFLWFAELYECFAHEDVNLPVDDLQFGGWGVCVTGRHVNAISFEFCFILLRWFHYRS